GGGSPRGAPAAAARWGGRGPPAPSPTPPSPSRNGGQRTPPVARPFGGYSAYGVTLTVTADVPGSAPALPATVTTTGSVPPGSTAPNQTTLARAASLIPAMPAADRPRGRTPPPPNPTPSPPP